MSRRTFRQSVLTAWIFLGLLGPASILSGGCQRVLLTPAPDRALAKLREEPLAQHVRFLAQPGLHGRCASTGGNRAAGDYIAAQMASAGLGPGGEADAWFQNFALEGFQGPASHCRLSFGENAELSCPNDYAPLASGCDGAFDAPLVFAGFGLHNRIRSYNDYENLNPRGSVVMVLQGEPHSPDGQSLWALPGKWTRLASAEYKLRQAAKRGASAVLLVTPEALARGADPLEMPVGDGKGPIPACRISRKVANQMLAPTGRTIDHLVQVIHATSEPASMAVGTRIRGTVSLQETRGRNVVGILPPDGRDSGRWIVVGAHYDHLSPCGDRARDAGFAVRPGADDNASGVSILLQVARALAKTPGRRRTVAFVAFDAEEYGFQGSKAFVARLQREGLLEKVDAMVNLDQLGQNWKNQIIVLGDTSVGPTARALRTGRAATDLRVQAIPLANSDRWSDQAPFARQGVDTLFFYAGRAETYHTRRDTPQTLSYPGMASAARLAYTTVRALASAGD